MQKICLEEIPFLVENKKISYRDAVSVIWERLYSNPRQFALNDFSEDERSDFLISFVGKIENFLEQFLKNKLSMSFPCYIRKCVVNSKQSWIRKKIISKVNDVSVESFSQSESENDIHRYEINEVGCAVSDRRSLSEYSCSRKRRVAEMAALVLTMRACQDVNDSLIEKVSDFTGIEKDFIYEKIQELKEKNEEKESRREVLVRRRDNSFYFRRRYQIEMERLDGETKMRSKLEEKVNLHGKNWRTKNEILNKSTSASPSADQIALTLGLRPRQVRFYISHIKHPENIEKIRRIVEDTEAQKDGGEERSEKS